MITKIALRIALLLTFIFQTLSAYGNQKVALKIQHTGYKNLVAVHSKDKNPYIFQLSFLHAPVEYPSEYNDEAVAGILTVNDIYKKTTKSIQLTGIKMKIDFTFTEIV